ncbi:MAG TPA: lamin tail domain-containing protein [Candidatus Acidoferrum sp.]|nr:lamin tail domain-containing protein [Candidatus Acidoferrum sp.]
MIATTIQGAQVTNTIPPYVQSQNPAGGGTVAGLSSIQVIFSESVSGVNASDLLINSSPASGVSGNGNVYTFTFLQPAYGVVNVTWAGAHGIVDQGTPTLPFNGAASSNIWSYTLLDSIAPTVVAKTPAAGATLTNLNSINVVFSENVNGVNASDLLINGSPAIGMTANSGSNYTFSFSEPGPGTVAITWAVSHGIVDASPSMNALDRNGATATWSYFFQRRITLVATNAVWSYFKGLSEASSPTDQWRLLPFDDASWLTGAAPFYYTSGASTYTGNTELGDMQNNYTTVFLRRKFVVQSPGGLTNLALRYRSDDGFVCWINGVEKFRMPNAGQSNAAVSFTSTAGNNNALPNYTTAPIGLNALVPGTNIITILLLNANLPSTDILLDVDLIADALDSSATPPTIQTVSPSAGDVLVLTNITVTFSEPVSGVTVGDLLINGAQATAVVASNATTYRFSFAQPSYGNVNVTWAAGHGIVDLDSPPKPFDGAAPGAVFTYSLINPSAPTVSSQSPGAGGTVSNLTQITVVFSEAVANVNAADFRVNSVPAANVSGGGATYTFSFVEPAYGPVAISWTPGHGITDTALPANAFDPARPGNTWQYTLIDRTLPTLFTKNPVAGASVTNITSLNVTFSENVTGVNANDLLVNGIPATSFLGTGSNYTFNFTQPNQSVVNLTWALTHGVVDTAGNAFDSAGPGATWQYFTPDNVPPVISAYSPPQDATVRALTQVAVTFAEPVTGVNPGDLRINNVPATGLSGSAAGPYTFTFTQPATGAVEIAWAAGHGITDLASPANPFAGGAWNYVLDPNAVFAGKIVINEIMYQPSTFNTNEEWFELRSLDSAPINLNGWKITSGVKFTFPNVSIPANGYLVVAANVDVFQSKYPGVANVVGGWTGTLANNGENIRLETSLDEEVDEVEYASEGEWAVRYHVIPNPAAENTQYGWIWRSDADGLGKSLELINSAMPNDFGQNWRTSIPNNGTPGVVNSVAVTNVAPIITETSHFPAVPRTNSAVVISARIFDEQPNVTARVFYRNVATLTPGAFLSLQMFDDGAHDDGLAGDKIFAASLPFQTNDAVVEFYVQAVDIGLRTNTFPAPAVSETNVVGQFANALYQVDERTYAFPQPIYKFIMTEQERVQRDFIASSRPQSDAEMNTTFISIDGTGTDVRYNCGIRERGAGSRGYVPANHRVNIPNDRAWHDQTEMNLNTRFTHPQYAGYLLSILSGLDVEMARVVRVRLNNRDQANSGSPQYGCYVHHQPPGSELMTVLHPLDDGGNIYRAGGARNATLAYLGTNPVSYQNQGYDKVSNSSENNWNDLFALTFALSPNTPDSNYTAAVRAIVNVEEWMTYFAVDTLLFSRETTLATGAGDDYTLYFAPIEQRFYVAAHDWDTVLNQGDATVPQPNFNGAIFRGDALAAINRFMHWPEFEQIYYTTLRRLAATSFAPANSRRTLEEHLGTFVPQNVINDMAIFASNRVNYVLSILPPDSSVPGALPSSLGGTITTNAIMRAANSPFTITSTLTVANGATLAIEPGAVVQLNSGVSITIANGGRLIAEGAAASPILFTRNGAGGNGGNIVINGSVGSPESRIAYARIEFNATGSNPAIDVNAGTAVLDHLTFGNTSAPYIHVDGASFVISHCEFPANTTSFEQVHGNGAVKSGGRGIFYRNWFGKTSGYNDSIDFTGGNRPGPIVHFIENVFTGSDDDQLDIDGTDAWVEGNIFLHVHRNGSPDSASAVSGGDDSGQTSEMTIVNNIFYDVDQAATAKLGNHYTFLNNTVVHQSSAAGEDAGAGAALNFADEGIGQARGMYVEGNIFFDIERLTRDVTNGTPVANNTFFTNNLMPLAWAGPGGGNSAASPLLKSVPTMQQTTNFTNWASAQVLRTWLSLLSNSPGIATGPGGTDKGFAANGATVTTQFGVTTNDAVFRVHFNRAGNGIPSTANTFPNGSGYTHFKWRLDGGPWSSETPIASTVTIPGFFSGTHRFDVSGKRDSGLYQDDSDFGELALPTSVHNNAGQSIRINEFLASNQSAVNHEGSAPDVVELYNPRPSAVNISGLRLTDDVEDPNKFIFPLGTTIPAGGYLVIYANDPDGTSGIHLGFALSKSGQSLYLYDKVDNGGVLIDSVTYGLQATDYSAGRFGTNWILCGPTFGSANLPAVTGDETKLVINEILTSEVSAFPDDFVEIANPQAQPVDMSGLFFTDNPWYWPDRSPVPALTFIEAGAYIAFRADGNTDSGADHLSFSLAAERGLVALLNLDYSPIDLFLYGPQTTDISQGRSPSNGAQSNLFTIPTPGAPNAPVVGTNTGVVINEVLAANSTMVEPDGSTPDWIEFYNNSSSAVDITGARFTDDLANLTKYVFPAGSIIAGNGFLRLRCDGGQLPSATNTGFNIKAESGSLYLFDKIPGGLLSAVTYGLQASDFSIGRVPTGTGGFVLTLPTPLGPNIAASLASANAVRVNEWMPAPNTGEDWFELYNPNPQPVAIGGHLLTDDLSPAGRFKSPIAALSFLGANTNGYQQFWADSAQPLGADHCNFKLSNTGEGIGFYTPLGVLIDAITFTNPLANISEGRFPDGAATILRFPGTESPNEANYLLLTNVVINEALTHTDLPFEDAIELRNLRSTNINIGGWWLSDAKGNLRKYRIPDGTILTGNTYRVFYEYQFNNDPTNNPSAFALGSRGDDVYLSVGDAGGNLTGFRTSVKFDAAFNGISFGRYVTSDNREDFVAMSARSFGQDDAGNVATFRTGHGAANPYPRVGPIVVARIMYHPPDINGTNDDTLSEFVELRNVNASTQPLYDPAFPTNTWRLRDAIDYDFPQGVALPAGGSLLLVSFDPINNPGQLAAFRAKYAVDASMPIFGPYTGKFANNDDKVELWRPDAPDPSGTPYVLVERIHYYDLSPWPLAADGTGGGLQRIGLTAYGNDPANWTAAVPNFGGALDSDGDGMPNAWEDQYGLNYMSAGDANLDLDGDGLTNLQEYLAGTDPTSSAVNNPYSAVRVWNVEAIPGTTARLTFVAISNRTYTIEYKNTLSDPAWLRLTDVSAVTTNRTMLINTVVQSTNRFFRLRTPQAP